MPDYKLKDKKIQYAAGLCIFFLTIIFSSAVLGEDAQTPTNSEGFESYLSQPKATTDESQPSSSIEVRTSLPKSIVAAEAENNPLSMKEPSSAPGGIFDTTVQGIQGKRFGVLLDRPVQYQGKNVQALPIDSYVNMKFEEINKRLGELDQRIKQIEKNSSANNGGIAQENNSPKPDSDKKKDSTETLDELIADRVEKDRKSAVLIR